ncbi:LysR substrate-binding domain-containing protein [Geobacillus zalihae]|uniref:LysR substrate-binding domain-containing protein n=2 Tax=Anoxybacillaceae TaxID=3120669 RepID=UPI00035891FD|nr:LysR substrate-binding domain-containing protein [Geobacillus zalihae]EPR28129.1 hypothetical protein I656_02229 [Geobacillus sp. WSUCF1]WKA48954.1 LysR substrate-binding domain-containing protein [Geobacillus zalihae]
MNGCYQAGFYPKVVQETQELPTVISLVSAGMGVALVPASMQYVFKNKVVYRDIQNNPFTTTMALACLLQNKNTEFCNEKCRAEGKEKKACQPLTFPLLWKL